MKNILVVDDEKNNISVIERFLKPIKPMYKISSTTNPNEAYDLIKKGDFDLVICDTDMPEMSGLDLKIKLNKEEIGVPFIGVSGRDYKEEWEKLGCLFLEKPYKLEELLNTIEVCLK